MAGSLLNGSNSGFRSQNPELRMKGLKAAGIIYEKELTYTVSSFYFYIIMDFNNFIL